EGAATTPGPGLWRRLRSSPWAWAAVLALVVALAAGPWLLRARLGAVTAPAGPVKVAVLPFDVIGENPEAQAFADGLLDEIVSVLNAGQIEAVSRQDSATLRGAGREQAMRRLGVGLILDGAVQRDGSDIRVSAHIDDPVRHVVLWSKDFTSPAAAPE